MHGAGVSPPCFRVRAREAVFVLLFSGSSGRQSAAALNLPFRCAAALIGSGSIKELIEELDTDHFWQIHRSTLVNAGAIAGISRDLRGRMLAHIRLLYQSDPPLARRMLDHLMRYLALALPKMRELGSTLGAEWLHDGPVRGANGDVASSGRERTGFARETTHAFRRRAHARPVHRRA